MSDNTTSINMTCSKCGKKTKLAFEDEEPTDDSTARCSECGVEFGRYGDIKAEAIKIAKEHGSRMIKDVFKGLKGWKVR